MSINFNNNLTFSDYLIQKSLILNVMDNLNDLSLSNRI